MTDDLFDIAKPVRDASVAEIERVLEDDAPESVIAGNKLGAHFVSLCIAFASRRFDVRSGIVNDPIADVMGIALASVLTHCAAGFRPVDVTGKPATPTVSGQVLLQNVASTMFQMLETYEAGLQDFILPFHKNEDGSLEQTPFDAFQMMKDKP